MKFFGPEGKKIEKFDVFRGNFPNPNPNHRWLAGPKPSLDESNKKLNEWMGHFTRYMKRRVDKKINQDTFSDESGPKIFDLGLVRSNF